MGASMNDPIDSATSIARAAADAAGGPPTPTTGEDRVVTYFGAVDLLLATGLNVTTAQTWFVVLPLLWVLIYIGVSRALSQ
jgi:hypothetical protein